ncbi:MAG: IPT/TIG domain-containing protein [Bryobacteraceae bacterium]
MKLSFVAALLAAASLAQQPMPRMTTVEPPNGKVGDILTVAGENLAKPPVEKVYLTDGKNDIEVEVTEQAATAVKFKIPTKAKPGRFSLMVLTGGKDQRLIEQPVKVTVE